MTNQVSFDLENAKALQARLRDFYATLWQEWSIVKKQWANLEQIWQDEQFDQFEPKFSKLSQTYEQAIQECEEYRAFLAQQIKLVEDRKLKLGELVEKGVTGVQALVSLTGLGNNSLVAPLTQLDPYSLSSYVQQQNSSNSCSLDKKPDMQTPTSEWSYENMPGLMRVITPEDQLNEAYPQAKEKAAEKRKQETEASIRSANQPTSSGSPNPDADP